MLLAGAAAGSVFGSGLADKLGRRMALVLSAVPTLIGSVITAATPSLWWMLAGRVTAGVGIGLSSALVPLYLTEVCTVRAEHQVGRESWLYSIPRLHALGFRVCCCKARIRRSSRCVPVSVLFGTISWCSVLQLVSRHTVLVAPALESARKLL